MRRMKLRSWEDTFVPIFTLEIFRTSYQSTRDAGVSYFNMLQEFFNDPSRARSLLITEETYAAAARALFNSLARPDRWVN